MQRNKYLEDIGIPIDRYSTNFTFDDDRRQLDWKEQREIYGFDDRETWNLETTFVEWLYSRCMMYKEIGGNVVDLTFHKFTHDGKEYTQIEAIDCIIEYTKEYLQSGFIERDSLIEKVQYATHLWAEILPAMWW